MKNSINKLKEELNSKIEEKNSLLDKEVLEISQRLDKLIIKSLERKIDL